jgi:hypothetical protein
MYLYSMTNAIWVPENVPSSKNSKQITRSGFIVHSKLCQAYYKATKNIWVDNRARFHNLFRNEEKPLYIGFYYVRKSKHKFDYNNVNQTLTDLMTKYGWLDDDNSDEITSVFLGYKYDKDKPGVYILNAGSLKESYADLCSKILVEKPIKE